MPDFPPNGGVPRAVPVVELLTETFDGRRIGHLSVEAPGERDEWELHPDQDELLYLLEGAVDVYLRSDPELEEEQVIHLRSTEVCVIPQGMWHRQIVVAPCRMLFVTPKTLHRTYVPPDGWLP